MTSYSLMGNGNHFYHHSETHAPPNRQKNYLYKLRPKKCNFTKLKKGERGTEGGLRRRRRGEKRECGVGGRGLPLDPSLNSHFPFFALVQNLTLDNLNSHRNIAFLRPMRSRFVA